MKKIPPLAICILLVACASDPDKKSPDALKNDAIDDFIRVAELEPVDRIRTPGAIHHEAITEDYVFLSSRRNTWLVKFARRCYEITGDVFRADVRRNASELRPKVDTIRGCPIAEIYPVGEGMIEEIKALTRPYEDP